MSTCNNFNNIKLTKMQEESINYVGSDMLVKGVAGSGKSVVIIKRALALNKRSIENSLNDRIAIFTFAKSLVKYTGEVFSEIPGGQRDIVISTFDSYCWRIFKRMTGEYNPHMQNAYEQKKLVEKAMQLHYAKNKKDHRFYTVDSDFWAEEFIWIKERNITSEQEYRAAERKGRGGKVRIKKEERDFVYEMFELYEVLKNREESYDWSDMYTYILSNANRIPREYKLDYVLIDEAQDLTYAKLKTAKLLTKKELTIAADQAQKIYKTLFSWAELGIDIRGRRTKILERPFRSSKQIVQLASTLQNVNRFQSDSEEFTDVILPEREGNLPKVIKCENIRNEQRTLVNLIKACLKNNDVIGILFRSVADMNEFKGVLYKNGIEYQMIHKKSEWSVKTPGVKLSTLHSSKGLEFDSVIIPYMHSRNYPHEVIVDEKDTMLLEEILVQERSLLYVGMTRARYELFMTYNGQESIFLREMEHKYYDYYNERFMKIPKPEQITYDLTEQKDVPEKDSVLNYTNLEVGILIEHPVFGCGMITEIKERPNGDAPVLIVDFEVKGEKKIKFGSVPMKII